MQPLSLDVRVGGRRVPAVLWQPTLAPSPLVLLGHGGGGHKTSTRHRALAMRLVEAGVAVAVIDGPAHGERAEGSSAPGAYQALLVERGIETVVRDMVDDWLACIDAVRATGAVDSRLAYVGMSMGTRFGLPLAAELGDRLACVVLGKFGLAQAPSLHPGLHIESHLRTAAAGVRAPTLWHVPWDDELFPRQGQFDLYDVIGAPDKRLLSFPGRHGDRPAEADDHTLAFLAHYLPRLGANGQPSRRK